MLYPTGSPPSLRASAFSVIQFFAIRDSLSRTPSTECNTTSRASSPVGTSADIAVCSSAHASTYSSGQAPAHDVMR